MGFDTAHHIAIMHIPSLPLRSGPRRSMEDDLQAAFGVNSTETLFLKSTSDLQTSSF